MRRCNKLEGEELKTCPCLFELDEMIGCTKHFLLFISEGNEVYSEDCNVAVVQIAYDGKSESETYLPEDVESV